MLMVCWLTIIIMDKKLAKMEIKKLKDWRAHEGLQGYRSFFGWEFLLDREPVDKNFSRAMDHLKLIDGQVSPTRALVILYEEGKIIHKNLHIEYTRSEILPGRPGKVWS
eukprot:GFUD01111785.1.p1 GENE.GFUD01111785.1~~GFUD01111785.1.p1  ORF type:complete len:109 (-),score=27.49 GFUD01111785.1:69-395(-)